MRELLARRYSGELMAEFDATVRTLGLDWTDPAWFCGRCDNIGLAVRR